MTASHGFELLREHSLAELATTARHYRHLRTRAELLSLINNDENKVFGITFSTPDTNPTSVAHILEHSVLCGSNKYPVKDPFIALLKSSVKTYLDAMTFPDMTCYPAASQNLRDFYNLMDVYFDAVFFPRLSRRTFQQEGWRYEVDPDDGSLAYNGVVFNETKGLYSSPMTQLMVLACRSLYPDTPYGLCLGDHTDIPDLTYERFKAFHARHYHPSNAKFFFHGDDDPDERLRLIDARLACFSRTEVDGAAPLQARFAEPRRVSTTYAASPNGAQPPSARAPARESMLEVSWMLDEITSVETAIGLDVLEQVLIGSPAAPLYKALIDSGLGEGVTRAGFDHCPRQSMFSVGLKGVDAADAEKIERLIDETIGRLATDGIDPATVAAALNTVEFGLRENNSGWGPRGLALMFKTLRAWMRGRDPIALLAFAEPLAAVKARIAEGGYLEDLLARSLVRNPHRAIVLLRPDSAQVEREAQEETQRLTRARAAMTPADVAALAADNRALARVQDTPDSPEALATIPALKLSDLPPRNKPIPIEVGSLGDTRVLYHDIVTNGIVYLDLAFDLARLPPDLVPYVPLFGRALTETGVGDEDVVALSQRIGRSTGGISTTYLTSVTADRRGSTSWLLLRGKALASEAQALIAILQAILAEARLDNQERIRQLTREEKANLESSLTFGGSDYVDRRLRACYSQSAWANDMMGGLGQLLFLRSLADRIDTDFDAVAAALERIRATLVDRAAMLANVTTEPAVWAALQPQLAGLLAGFPARAAAPAAPWPVADWPRAEGLVMPTKVNFVGKSADLYASGLKPSGANLMVERHVGLSWLWDKVRLQGGAYGGHCKLDPHSGVFTFLSYRDPNLIATLDVYDRTVDFLRTVMLTDAELTGPIIATIGALDSHLLPDAKGYASMRRYLTGETEEMRQQLREEVFATTRADFRHFADALAQAQATGRVAVLGSEQAIAAANSERPGLLTVRPWYQAGDPSRHRKWGTTLRDQNRPARATSN